MATNRYVEVVIPELFDIYFNVVTHLHMVFNAEFIYEAIFNFYGFVKESIQEGRHLRFNWSKSIVIRIRDTYSF